MSRKRIYRIDSQNKLVDGMIKPADWQMPSGYFDGTSLDSKKQWQLNEQGDPVEQAEDTELKAEVTETARIYAGIETQAKIAVAMKGDGAVLSVLTPQQFKDLNKAGEPVSSALIKGQFQTALERWREIFSATTTVSQAALIKVFVTFPAFEILNAHVESVIKAKMAEYDGMTQAELAAF